ncbi:serine hydrolase domain-containing protein [Pseudonocardia sp. ICBG1293]|uniref:serine hydrolase domain-containing protein n=1 Tax=Pseudonocardia sp. ICBG1293 TaxID=2844382 RepID=UPI0035A84256
MLVGAVAGPERQRLGPQTSGDAALADRVRAAAGGHDGYRSLAVAEITPTTVTTAGLGPADGGAPFEIGSVTKTFTAAVFADAVTRGEVRPDEPLERALPELAGTPAGAVTLAALAQHRSGLPPLGATAAARAPAASAANLNPYSSTTTAQLLDDARAAPVDPQQPPTYSNLGVALLGTALVRAAGAEDYPALIADRITGPLGMTSTTFARTGAQVPDTAVPGHRDNGRPAPRWVGEGYLPAGSSTFSTVDDLARWAQAQLTGVAPGTGALTPTAQDAPGTAIGWIWVTGAATGADGARHPYVWHNGATAGFSSMLALDRDGGRAVVVLGDTTAGVEPVARTLLFGTPPAGGGADLLAWVPVAIAALFSLLALRRAVREGALLPIADGLLTAVFGLVLLWNRGPGPRSGAGCGGWRSPRPRRRWWSPCCGAAGSRSARPHASVRPGRGSGSRRCWSRWRCGRAESGVRPCGSGARLPGRGEPGQYGVEHGRHVRRGQHVHRAGARLGGHGRPRAGPNPVSTARAVGVGTSDPGATHSSSAVASCRATASRP